MGPSRVGTPGRCLFVRLVLPTAFFVLEPALVLLAVGRGCASQRPRVSWLLVSDFGSLETGIIEDCSSQVGSIEVGSSEVGSSEVGVNEAATVEGLVGAGAQALPRG